MTEETTALTTEETTGQLTLDRLEQSLMRRKETLRQTLAEQNITPERFVRVVTQTVAKNPRLLECTPFSLVSSILEAAQLGLEPTGLLGGAYLVPYRVKGKMVASLIIGYRGYIDLARRGGELDVIEARVVHEKDQYELVFGTQPILRHVPTLETDRGNPVGAYMLARPKGSTQTQVEWMTYDEIELVRKRSKSAQDGPWVSDWGEMARKTVVRRGIKYLPLSVHIRRAIEIEDEMERRAEPRPTVEVARGDDPRSQLLEHLTGQSEDAGRDGGSEGEGAPSGGDGGEGAEKAVPVAPEAIPDGAVVTDEASGETQRAEQPYGTGDCVCLEIAPGEYEKDPACTVHGR